MTIRFFLALLGTSFLSFVLTGCGAATPSKDSADTIVVAMVGDSITYSGGDSNSAGVVPQLQNMLGDAYSVLNFGVNGATALRQSNKPYWTQPEYQSALKSNPDAVIIMLGTNDSKTENWKGGDNNFQTDYYDLIDSLQSLPSKPMIWLGLNLPAYSDEWTINGEVIENEIHPKIKDIAYMASVTLIDYHSMFDGKQNLLSDGIHPNYEGNKVMATKLAQILRGHYSE